MSPWRHELESVRAHDSLDETGVVLAFAEFAAPHDGGVKRNRRLDSGNVIFVERMMSSEAFQLVPPRAHLHE